MSKMEVYNEQLLPCNDLVIRTLSSLVKKPSIDLYSSYIKTLGAFPKLQFWKKLSKIIDAPILENIGFVHNVEREYP